MNQPISPFDELAGLPEPEPPMSLAEAEPDESSTNNDQLLRDQREGNHDLRMKPNEELGPPSAPSDVRPRQKRWLVGCGILILLILLLALVGFFVLIQRGMAEVRGMGPWPGPEVSPGRLATVDLSHLGLSTRQVQNAREREEWAGGSYEDGVLIEYEVDKHSVVYVWILRYENEQLAGNDYHSIQAWTGITGNCGRSIYLYYGSSGLVHCQFSDASIKTFWNDCWIVQIVALEGTEFTPDVLVDKVRDAVAAHWKAIEAP